MRKSHKKNVYIPAKGSSDHVEEALANFDAREQIKSLLDQIQKNDDWKDECVQTVLKFIDDQNDASPPGYRDWRLGYKNETWHRLAAQVISGEIHPSNSPPLGHVLKTISESLLRLQDIPIHFTTEISLADHLKSSLKTVSEY